MGGLGQGLDVLDDAEEVRRLADEAGDRVVEEPGQGRAVDAAVPAEGDLDGLEAEVPDVGPDDLAVLRVERPGDEDLRPVGQPVGHEDGLGRPGRALVERGVGDVEAGELADERLELEDDLERPLADLGLVGRVGCHELAPRAQGVDDRGDEMVVGAAAEEGQEPRVGVPRRGLLHLPDEVELGHGPRQREVPRQADVLRDAAEEVRGRADADRGQHLLPVVVAEREIAHGLNPFLSTERKVRLRGPPGISRTRRPSSGPGAPCGP